MAGYTIELDLRGRTAVVVGLGGVGRRKASGLLEAEARVVGVDPGPRLAPPGGVEHVAEPFRAGHLVGASLAFAAGPPEVNRRVVEAARAAGVWVNASSEPGRGDFLVPAVRREGPVTLTASTGGASPALARLLVGRAARSIGEGPALAALLAEFRPEVLARVADPAARRRLLAGWADSRWLDDLARLGPDAVRLAWRRELDTLPGADMTLPETENLS